MHVVDEDIASRWGPRVVDFIELISELLAEREQAPVHRRPTGRRWR